MSAGENTSSAPRVGARVTLHDRIPAGSSHPPLEPYQMNSIDKSVLAQYVTDTPMDTRPDNSFHIKALFADCKEASELLPPRGRFKQYSDLLHHFNNTCLGKDCPAFGRGVDSGIGREGTKGRPTNLYPVSYGPG